MTPLLFLRKETHYKLAFLRIKVNFFSPYFQTFVKIEAGSASFRSDAIPDPDLDRRQNGNLDPDRHINTMPIHNTGEVITIGTASFLGTVLPVHNITFLQIACTSLTQSPPI
jgi:hypothetical protein